MLKYKREKKNIVLTVRPKTPFLTSEFLWGLGIALGLHFFALLIFSIKLILPYDPAPQLPLSVLAALPSSLTLALKDPLPFPLPPLKEAPDFPSPKNPPPFFERSEILSAPALTKKIALFPPLAFPNWELPSTPQDERAIFDTRWEKGSLISYEWVEKTGNPDLNRFLEKHLKEIKAPSTPLFVSLTLEIMVRHD